LFRRLKLRFKEGFYRYCVSTLTAIASALFRFQVIGRENLKQDGSYVLVARHRSYWDIPLMAAAVGVEERVHFIARRGLMRGLPFLRIAVHAYSTVIDRENFSRDDFRRMLDAFKRERLIGLFPEGTTRQQADAKGGAIHFASLARKDFLPVNIRAEGPYPPRYPFRYPRITVSIGTPVSVAELERGLEHLESRAERYRDMSARLMQRVDTA